MAPISAWRRVAERLSGKSRLGIAARLSIAFGAVAVLAVAANQIALHGTTALLAIEQAPLTQLRFDGSHGPEVLPAALDQFQRAVLARAEAPSGARGEAYEEAMGRLDAARATHFHSLTPIVDESALLDLDRQVTAHGQLAAQLIHAADARRRLLHELNTEFAALDARMKASLDQMWALFGKVVRREYLLDANRITDELGRHVADLSALQGYGPATVGALAAGEQEFAALLRQNENSIIRAFGAEWLAQTRGNFERVTWLRQLLVRTDVQRRATIDDFSHSHATLSTSIRKINSRFEAARAVASARRQSAAALTIVSEREQQQRSRLTWLTAGVLIILLAITVSTVTSVVLPVRRLVHATRRLAQGERVVPVPRGGIRELDTLAVSFNQMSERLAAAQELARQYHAQLEAKVEERTRQLQHLAAHDPLTRLPNRRQFLLEFASTLRRASESGRLAGVFFLDLDNFKNVNDSMGHVFGDRVLQAVGERLSAAVRRFGYCARLGGDEFTVVYEQAAHPEEIQRAAERVVAEFLQPLVVDGRELLMGLSIGASVYPADGTEPETLLRAADAALFHAKARGRSQVRLFSPDLLEAAAAKFATEQGLRRAVERGEFELHFQPEVNLATGVAGLVEALLRWRLPDGSFACPQDFLPVAEDCGLIREIGEWVLQSTVQHAARWRREAWPEVRVAFNVSSLQLLDSRFVDGLRRSLAQNRVPPESIEVELTENVLQTGRHTSEALLELREMGVGVALDDFGTGYSSLVSLQQLPLTRVKLDRSLIATIDTSARSQAITRTIIALCQSLGLEVTAEGVEREAQLTWLLGYPAVHLQGFLLSPPVAEADLLPALTGMPSRLDALIHRALPANAVPIGRVRPSRLRKMG